MCRVQVISGLMSVNFARAVELEPVKLQQHDWGLLRAFSIPRKSYRPASNLSPKNAAYFWAENCYTTKQLIPYKLVTLIINFFQGHNIVSSRLEQEMVTQLRDICDRHSKPDDITITVFHPWFIYIDQYLAILPQTMQVCECELRTN